MSHTSGPCSTLRGSSHLLPSGAMCDDHPGRPALKRIQGETDSFGAEYHYMCKECIDDFKKSIEEDRKGRCDWCKKDATDLRDKRDFEEGMNGRVYRVCGSCVEAEARRCQAELDRYYNDYGDYDD